MGKKRKREEGQVVVGTLAPRNGKEANFKSYGSGAGNLRIGSSETPVSKARSWIDNTLLAIVRDEKQGRSQISALCAKKDLIGLNKLISEFGLRRKLALALEAFDVILGKMKPTVHSFAQIMNACLRCSDIEDARRFYSMMQNEYGIPTNEVTFTTIIKGECQEGSNMERALRLLSSESSIIQPNVRTLNTLLRGCVKFCDNKSAKKLLKQMKTLAMSVPGCNPDACSYEYCIKTSCYGGKLESAWKIVKKMTKLGMTPSAAAFSDIALCSALLGDEESARKAMKMAKKSATESANHANPRGSSAMKHRESLEVFNNLRSSEALQLCKMIDSYCTMHMQLDGIQRSQRQHTADEMRKGIRHIRQIISPSSPEQLEEIDLTRNHRKFLKRFHTQLPIKLEIGSGYGEWINERARLEQSKSNWVAVEIRLDRVYHIWSRSVLQSLDNLLLMCGPAQNVLEQWVPASSISEIYINFPPPPLYQTTDTRMLIDKELILQIYRVLSAGGSLYVVTDNASTAAFIEKYMIELKAEAVHDEFFHWNDSQDSLFSDQVPKHYISGTSYFDKLWESKNYTRRFFLHAWK